MKPWWDSWVAAIIIAVIATGMIFLLTLIALWHVWKLKAGF